MQKTAPALIIAALVLMGVGSAFAQDEAVDKVVVELTDPGEPIYLEVSLVNGGISVSGYDGDEVIIEAISGMKKLDRSRERSQSKISGLKRIPVNSSSLTVEEFENKIEISTDSQTHPVDLKIMVPKRASLNLGCVNHGDLSVENVIGDLEISNVNGAVTLLNIDGSVVASCQNENLIVTFTGINPAKDMSFSSFNGDVDVTFPTGLKAKVKLKTTRGEMYTDFDVKEVKGAEKVTRENRRDRDGRYEITVDRAFWGEIGGGGQIMEFSSYNGDIYIRQE